MMNFFNRKNLSMIWVYTFLAVSVCLMVSNKCEASSEKNLPKLIVITSYAQGSTGHALASGVSEVIAKKSPMDCRVTPGAGDIVRITPLKKQTGELALVTNATGFLALLGEGAFAKAKWGPQPIRMVWLGPVITNGVPWVLGDSGIKTMADMKGKRVADIAGASTYWANVEAALAFGGLTEDDVIKVPTAGYSKHFDALLEGVIDLCMGSTQSAKAMETAGSPHGIHWIDLDPNDKEAWARMHKYAPWYMPSRVTEGAGITADNPKNLCGYPYSVFAYKTGSKAVVYQATKAIAENYEILKPIHKAFSQWNLDRALNFEFLEDMLIPYHEGSIEYFKEIGAWTPQHEAWQKKVLKLEEERMAAWKSKK